MSAARRSRCSTDRFGHSGAGSCGDRGEPPSPGDRLVMESLWCAAVHHRGNKAENPGPDPDLSQFKPHVKVFHVSALWSWPPVWKLHPQHPFSFPLPPSHRTICLASLTLSPNHLTCCPSDVLFPAPNHLHHSQREALHLHLCGLQLCFSSFPHSRNRSSEQHSRSQRHLVPLRFHPGRSSYQRPDLIPFSTQSSQ